MCQTITVINDFSTRGETAMKWRFFERDMLVCYCSASTAYRDKPCLRGELSTVEFWISVVTVDRLCFSFGAFEKETIIRVKSQPEIADKK